MDELTGYAFAAVPLLGGWILDRIFGDPAGLPHPVVAFGNVIARLERRFNVGADRRRKGAVVAAALTVSVFVIVFALLRLLSPLPYLKLAVETLGVFYCLAGTSLAREVRMVFEACRRGLEAGRRQVARIVGRDTARLDGQEIRTAALETLAENLSDGVVAPLFWYLLLGLPGMMAYKMVNTLDSMIGYRNERYREFGCFAARADDAANFIPARVTAFLMLLSAGRLDLVPFVKRYGPCHASPNSGWPEAALAGILGCRFGGTHDYFGEAVYKPYIGSVPKTLTDSDLRVSLRVCFRAELLMLLAVLSIRLLFLF